MNYLHLLYVYYQSKLGHKADDGTESRSPILAILESVYRFGLGAVAGGMFKNQNLNSSRMLNILLCDDQNFQIADMIDVYDITYGTEST